MRRSSIQSACRKSLASFLFAVTVAALVGSRAAAQDLDGAPSTGQEEVRVLYEDFLHFARLGKFTEANAYANRLLEHSDLSPATLLQIADTDSNSVATLITLIGHTSLREPAQRVLDLIREGEFIQRQDVSRIRANVEKLSGPPQMEYNAIQRLKESGEYAIPVMVETLQTPNSPELSPRIIRALPQLGKAAVSPLVIALNTSNADVQRDLVWALGEVGYPQAIPYLLKLMQNPNLPAESMRTARESLQRIASTSDRPAAESAIEAFMRLANQYYNEQGSVKADPRIPIANVWYWEEERLNAKQVPTEIYGSIMAMRACEEALILQPNCREAIALWLAANFRREARLGMDVESIESDSGTDADSTRPVDFPRSIYFARSAGPEYCHLVLGRAVKDLDKDVALGAIAALDLVAGEPSLIGLEDFKQALVKALEFPDTEVRIKAAIALARALPQASFTGSDLVAPVLAEALLQGSNEQYLVVDADRENVNRIAQGLRESGATVVAESNFYVAMDRMRSELPAVSGIILSTDLQTPALNTALVELREENRLSRVPVIVLCRAGQEYRAEANESDRQLRMLQATATADEIKAAMTSLDTKSGGNKLSGKLADELALRATDAILGLAIDGKSSIDVTPTIGAIISSLSSPVQELQVKAARTLAAINSADGQRVTCELALNPGNNTELRIAAFEALAESAKRHGNLLLPAQASEIVKAAIETADLTMRTAASQALGALNLTSNEASEIIRRFYRG